MGFAVNSGAGFGGKRNKSVYSREGFGVVWYGTLPKAKPSFFHAHKPIQPDDEVINQLNIEQPATVTHQLRDMDIFSIYMENQVFR